MARYLKSDGAGYNLDTREWKKAADEGFKEKIMAALVSFEKPVDVMAVTDRVLMRSYIPYTQGEVESMLSKLCREGRVVSEAGLYSVREQD